MGVCFLHHLKRRMLFDRMASCHPGDLLADVVNNVSGELFSVTAGLKTTANRKAACNSSRLVSYKGFTCKAYLE